MAASRHTTTTDDGFTLKSSALTVTTLVLDTADLAALDAGLERRCAAAPGLFDREPVVIDLQRVAEDPVDIEALVALLRRYRMQPLAVRGGGQVHTDAALAAGLVEAPEGQHAAAPAPRDPVAAAAAAPRTLIVDRPLRSGQQVYARGGDLVVLAVVSYGAEVIADGSIHVYAPLRGRAAAGARGDTEARIFATCMEPQLLAIAGTYRTTETELPADVLGKAAQVRLDGERLVVEALKA